MKITKEMYISALKKQYPQWEEAYQVLCTFDEKEYGQSLKRVRMAIGLTLDDVISLGGKELGISRSTLSAMEAGRQKIGIKQDVFLRKLYILT